MSSGNLVVLVLGILNTLGLLLAFVSAVTNDNDMYKAPATMLTVVMLPRIGALWAAYCKNRYETNTSSRYCLAVVYAMTGLASLFVSLCFIWLFS